jgi:hypothetical protein
MPSYILTKPCHTTQNIFQYVSIEILEYKVVVILSYIMIFQTQDIRMIDGLYVFDFFF